MYGSVQARKYIKLRERPNSVTVRCLENLVWSPSLWPGVHLDRGVNGLVDPGKGMRAAALADVTSLTSP